MLARTGAVAADPLPPFVEDVAPRIAVPRCLEVADLPGARVEHVGARGAEVSERSPRCLERRAHRHALEHVQQAARAGLEGAGRVVRVFRGPAVEHVNHDVGLVVAVGVLQPQHPWLVYHEHAAVEKLEAGGAVQLVVEDRALVGQAVVVRVFEDHELVRRLRGARLPLRITRHRRHPEASLGIKRQLHRVGDLGEFALVGEELDFEPRWHRAGFDELLRRQDHRAPLGILAVGLPRLAEPRLRQEQFAGA